MLRLPLCYVEHGNWYSAQLQGTGEDEPQPLAPRPRPWLLGDWALNHILLFKAGTGTEVNYTFSSEGTELNCTFSSQDSLLGF